MNVGELIRSMESPPPAFDADSAARTAREAFGIDGRCLALAGERDANFRLTAPDGSQHLLKIWNHAQDEAVIDLQIRAMQHIRRHDAGIPVPAIETDVGGKPWVYVEDSGGRRHAACLLSWLDGRFVRETPPGRELGSSLGRWLARLDRSLTEFQHPAQDRDMAWDLARADRLGGLLDAVGDTQVRGLASRTLEQFRETVLPALEQARRQVIHGDFNPDNVLVGRGAPAEVSGIIDFGDTMRAPLICEVAIACAYQLSAGANPIAGALPVIRAYHGVLPLSEGELGMLPGLIRARLVASIVIPSFMASRHPENREYLLVDTASAADYLRRLEGAGNDADGRRIIEACADG